MISTNGFGHLYSKNGKKNNNPNLNVTTLHKNQLKMDQRAKQKT